MSADASGPCPKCEPDLSTQDDEWGSLREYWDMHREDDQYLFHIDFNCRSCGFRSQLSQWFDIPGL